MHIQAVFHYYLYTHMYGIDPVTIFSCFYHEFDVTLSGMFCCAKDISYNGSSVQFNSIE